MFRHSIVLDPPQHFGKQTLQTLALEAVDPDIWGCSDWDNDGPVGVETVPWPAAAARCHCYIEISRSLCVCSTWWLCHEPSKDVNKHQS